MAGSFGGGSGEYVAPPSTADYIRSLDWGNGDQAAAQLHDYMIANNVSTNDVANAMNLDPNVVAQGAADHGYTDLPANSAWNGGGLGLATGTSNPYAYANSATPEYLAANNVTMGENNPNSVERQAAIAAAPAPGAPTAAFSAPAGGAAFGGTVTGSSGFQNDPGGFARTLHWGNPTDDQVSTAALYAAARQYGWTPEQMGKPLGFTGQDMTNHFQKYGYSVGSGNSVPNISVGTTPAGTPAPAPGGTPAPSYDFNAHRAPPPASGGLTATTPRAGSPTDYTNNRGAGPLIPTQWQTPQLDRLIAQRQGALTTTQ